MKDEPHKPPDKHNDAERICHISVMSHRIQTWPSFPEHGCRYQYNGQRKKQYDKRIILQCGRKIVMQKSVDRPLGATPGTRYPENLVNGALGKNPAGTGIIIEIHPDECRQNDKCGSNQPDLALQPMFIWTRQ